jgi:hypothetical protein
MSHDKFEWLRRIKSVEREHSVMRLAVDHFAAAARSNPSVFLSNLSIPDLAQASERLEGTYIVRLFAEFETGLRLFWTTVRASEPPTRDLVDGVAARRRVPDRFLEKVHDVREYRNALVHEREGAIASISLAEARGHLCRFFNFLPLTW